MPQSSYYAVQELLMRHGIDADIAKSVAMNELRQWELEDLSAIMKRVVRPTRDFCKFRSFQISEFPKFEIEKPSLKSMISTFKKWWPSLWTEQTRWVRAPRAMMEESARQRAALCVNAAGQWSIRSSGYVAISHVWIEGLQRDPVQGGLAHDKVVLIFETMEKAGIEAEWMWTDVMVIPGGGNPTASIEDEQLTTDIINTLPEIYSKADAVIIFDALVLQLQTQDPIDVAVTLLCGKWGSRVWTYQEIKLAHRALVVTATSSYEYADLTALLKTKAAKDPDRFRKMWLWFATNGRDDDVRITIPDIISACKRRKSGWDVDYARAFFPTLRLKWETGMTREQGIQTIFRSQRDQGSRVAFFSGCPRLSIRPAWAPSYLTGLEGIITEQMEWESRGCRGEWYSTKVIRLDDTFIHFGKRALKLIVEGDNDSFVQCVLFANEKPEVFGALQEIIERNVCYMISPTLHEPSSKTEFARTVLLCERATVEEMDGFEAAVHCAATIVYSNSYQQVQQQVLLRHDSPHGEMGKISGDLNYMWYKQEETSIPSTLELQEGESSLHVAIRNGRSSIVAELLSQGESTVAMNSRGLTPLHTAAARGDIESLKLMLSHTDNVDVRSQQVNKDTPLGIAAQYGHGDIIRLLSQHRADFNARNNNDYTPLMIAAYEGKADSVKELLVLGADPNCKDQTGFSGSPLLLSCSLAEPQESRLLVMSMLLDAGANVNGGDHPVNWTPLYKALEYASDAAVGLLIAEGANVNITENGTLRTPLYRAIDKSRSAAVRLLLDAGADRNAIAEGNWTSPHLAAKCENYEIMRMILEEPINVNLRLDSQGWTPLHIAVRSKLPTNVKLLLRAKADLDLRSREGLTPLELASAIGQVDIVQILEAARGTKNIVAD